mmetsp:Transcript_63153/g.124847  ORF Transcript_63153/g.124847 Transcript_63153/m.124847 type:complete len:237 (+) Transcript_63153:743-1453(+)
MHPPLLPLTPFSASIANSRGNGAFDLRRLFQSHRRHLPACRRRRHRTRPLRPRCLVRHLRLRRRPRRLPLLRPARHRGRHRRCHLGTRSRHLYLSGVPVLVCPHHMTLPGGCTPPELMPRLRPLPRPAWPPSQRIAFTSTGAPSILLARLLPGYAAAARCATEPSHAALAALALAGFSGTFPHGPPAWRVHTSGKTRSHVGRALPAVSLWATDTPKVSLALCTNVFRMGGDAEAVE